MVHTPIENKIESVGIFDPPGHIVILAHKRPFAFDLNQKLLGRLLWSPRWPQGRDGDKGDDQNDRDHGLDQVEIQGIASHKQRRNRRCYGQENSNDPGQHEISCPTYCAASMSSGDST